MGTREFTGIRNTLLKTSEGRLLIAGLCLAIVYAVWLGASYLLYPEKIHIIAGMTVANIFFGRAAGMSFGYGLDLGHGLVVPVNMVIETILVVLFYPLFVLSWNKLLVIRPLKHFMDRTRRAAESNQKKIQKYGIFGLLLFVWFPFWMTGPLVGCVIGFFLGLRPWLNMGVVLSGTYLAIIGWAILLHDVQNRLDRLSPYAPIVFIGLIIFLVVLGNLIRASIRKKTSRTDKGQPE